MSQRRAGIFNRCSSCKLNNDLCVCTHMSPFKINGQISLIVHVRELKLTSNSAQLVQKLIPQNSEIFIRGRVNDNFESALVMDRPGRPLFLYPHEDAVELNQAYLQANPGPYHLIVPDGNWHQARRVRKREEAFKRVPAVKLPPGILAEYQLRKAPQSHWVSTFEAVAHALGVLEGDEVRERMMSFFRIWVKSAAYNRNKTPGGLTLP